MHLDLKHPFHLSDRSSGLGLHSVKLGHKGGLVDIQVERRDA
ncbi:MAG: hypothetical protein WAU69_03075 [Solirubrobacteraceae bacterium]